MDIKCILAPLDLSEPSFGPLGMAIPLADLSGARLILLTVEPLMTGIPFEVPIPPDPENTMRRQKALFLKWAQTHPHFPHLEDQIRFRARHGIVVDEILRTADTERADLIVMATHCRSGVARMVLGSVTETVIRSSKRPVLAVPPGAWEPVATKG